MCSHKVAGGSWSPPEIPKVLQKAFKKTCPNSTSKDLPQAWHYSGTWGPKMVPQDALEGDLHEKREK